MKDKILKVVKVLVYIVVVLSAFGFIYHFIGGVYNSLFADDVITAQNRVASAYEFLYMIIYGIVLVISLYSSRLIKVHIFSEETEKKLKESLSKIKTKFSRK